MDETGGGKVTGIRQIVRLKEIIRKWQSETIKGKGGISPATNRRLRNSYVACDSDEENCQSPEPPTDVPKGYMLGQSFEVPILATHSSRCYWKRLRRSLVLTTRAASPSPARSRPSSIFSSAWRRTLMIMLKEIHQA
ncbi:hypothetical protein HHK36_021924 [Tetracentron sinense]|uniref:Uncharacterized protein n=1 Tax=Tetracentron sinense TaxID=13715 RepID=A0A835DAE9_TETSI|nr:hypothetical protein HHK36_021924 [Tetracentron sinense]